MAQMCVADDFDFFIQTTFPISHADLRRESLHGTSRDELGRDKAKEFVGICGGAGHGDETVVG